MPQFEDLIAEADRRSMHGWDFSYLRGRMVEEPLSYDFVDEVRSRLDSVEAAKPP